MQSDSSSQIREIIGLLECEKQSTAANVLNLSILDNQLLEFLGVLSQELKVACKLFIAALLLVSGCAGSQIAHAGKPARSTNDPLFFASSSSLCITTVVLLALEAISSNSFTPSLYCIHLV